ncbi:FAD-dependent oxidoreductase [Rhizobium binae]|uniref:FAD-dependent oxidoreductase n=1 Tax=Rhizobium binae TaxID=1138190 RepID=UPI001C838C24|nr:FAD-dependent oxidoreductase [Rhizobium binae]MBX4941191.1 FAD-dependent oxidoreductase [Rhizobium binae]
MDRLIWRGKQAAKPWWAKILGLYVADPEGLEADWLINWKTPGTYNLTKVGTPTFNSTGYFQTTANTSYYDTGIPLLSLPQNSFSFGFFSETSGGVGDCAMGAQDAGGVGITIAAKTAANVCVARAMSTAITGAVTASYDGLGFTSVTRDASNSVRFSHHGVTKETFTTASATPASNPTIRIGGAAGNASFSQRRIRCAYVCNQALTVDEEADMCAAIRDYLDKTRQGHINYFNPDADGGVLSQPIIVHGGSIPAICAAYEAKRQGQNVAILGDWLARSDWDLAGMPGAGLGFIDAISFGAVSGVFREMLKWINTVYYSRADTASQNGLSVESKAWVAAVRRMLDPANTTGTLPGLDIPVYFSQGLTSAAPYGIGGELTTVEGRKYRGTRVIQADYEGQLVNLLNLPRITGSEAKGTGGEAFNGYMGTTGMALPVSAVGGNQLIDPYNTPGTPASGLLPDLITLPGLSPGDPDPGLQGMNFRLALTNSAAFAANYDTSPPPNYNPLRYEALGRLYGANPTETFGNNIIKCDLVNGANGYDVNNGSNRLSTDVPQSGVQYALATTDAQRLAIIKDIRDYTRGYFYWHASSGDSRIPAALKTALTAFKPDATTFLDPGDEGVLFWPNRAYVRDPVWMMKNTGFVHTGNDFYNVVNGSALRSDKTVTNASYSADRHSLRHIAADLGSGMAIYSEGGMNQSGFGGTNGRSPIALESIVPDKANCQWLIAPIAASITKVVQYFYRMEYTISLAGQMAGIIAAVSIEDGVAVQDVDYTKVRTRSQATPDSVLPVLPQVN